MAPRVRALLDFLIERFAQASEALLGDRAYLPERLQQDLTQAR
jgi:hypothetical protein